MNGRALFALCASLLLLIAPAYAGRGGGGGARMGGFSGSRGGFDMHQEAPGGMSRSSTGPGGTQRTTNVTGAPGDYNRTTNAQNGAYNRTSSGSYNAQTGNYSHSSSGSTPYASRSGSTSGNAYTHNASHYANGTNAYGQTYSSAAYRNNGYVYRGAVVSNPVYGAYPAWGWNAGYAWAPVPYYWGGGFWGPYAWGAATAIAFGTYVTPSNTSVDSYQVEPSSPGAKLLASYKLTQTPCGPPNLVVIMGANDSVICAQPNSMVAAGTYGVDEKTLTLTSIAPK